MYGTRGQSTFESYPQNLCDSKVERNNNLISSEILKDMDLIILLLAADERRLSANILRLTIISIRELLMIDRQTQTYHLLANIKLPTIVGPTGK